MPTAALYARISQGDDKTPAVERQVSNLETFAAQQGYEIVRTYTDDGISAWSGKVRPGFLDLMLGVKNHEFDIILAVANDRLSRNDDESYYIRSECQKAGIRWHTIANGVTDLSDASGSMLAKITAALAEYESEVKAERIRRNVADRLAEGKDLGGPRPFGFEKDRRTIRESEAVLLRTAYKMIIEGGSIYAVAQMFTASGIQRDQASTAAWRTQTVRSILLRERNVGRLVVKGVTYADNYPAIVNVETFETVQAILNNPDRIPRRGPKPRQWAAIGIVRCGVCGSYMSQTGVGRFGKRDLRCAPDSRPMDSRDKRHPTMDADALDRQLSTAVLGELGWRVHEGLPVSAGHSRVAELRHRLSEVQRQRDVVQELAMTPGANLTAAKNKLAELGQDIETVQSDLDSALAGDAGTHALNRAAEILEEWGKDAFVYYYDNLYREDLGSSERPVWDAYWSGLDVAEQQVLVRALLRNLVLLPKGVSEIPGYRLSFDGLTTRRIVSRPI